MNRWSFIRFPLKFKVFPIGTVVAFLLQNTRVSMNAKVFSLSKNGKKNKTLLIIGEDEVLTKGLMISLIDYFDEIHIVSKRKEINVLLESKEMDVAIIDADIQGQENTKSVLGKIKQSNEHTSVIVMSSSFDGEIAGQIELSGTDRIFEKPFELTEMITYIKNIIQAKLKEN